ncbi:hypothetical protein [Persicirhabdus sediminis]|uniref:S1-like domain-containing protein n=1 Tax=Persicirhabdus sediminis TaxID=454144 RepID=A0A8J7SIW2_9BACT|nr:hypothetical protein [Persicirhabdus sediminis]MBK1790721.1 hypothetical protein [Persicirhabdus sediminis]
MSSESPITTTGTIIQRYNNGVYQVSLPNGKKIIGHVPSYLEELHSSLQPEDQVSLEMTPFDFEKGRIVGKVEAGE